MKEYLVVVEMTVGTSSGWNSDGHKYFVNIRRSDFGIDGYRMPKGIQIMVKRIMRCFLRDRVVVRVPSDQL